MAKILMIEDSLFICKFVEQILTSGGHEVFVETKGDHGIEAALTIMPDLILLSLVFEGKDGFEICKEIKKDGVLKDIPVIFVTSSDDQILIVEGFASGAADYILKPFKGPELLARIKSHISSKQVKDELKKYRHILEESLNSQTGNQTKDPVTNVFNKKYMLEKLANRFKVTDSSVEEDYIFLASIDNFKSVTDNYGKGAEDQVIKSIANIIQKYSLYNSLVSRWSGEEFLVATYNITKSEYIDMCNEIIRQVEQFKFRSGDDYFLETITIGATPIDYSKTVEENINMADDALYTGNNSGKNQLVISN